MAGALIPDYATAISDGTDETDVSQAEGTETVLPRGVSDKPSEEHINLPVDTQNAQPRGAENGIVEPTGTRQQPANSFSEAVSNRKPERDEGEPAPHPATSSSPKARRHHKQSQKKGRREKPSSKQYHNGRRDQTRPWSRSGHTPNRSRDHTGSTIQSDSGSYSARFHPRAPSIDRDESDLYKGFCWGWKPSWCPQS